MFPAAVSAGNKTRARTSGYWSRTIACVNDNEVIFRCRAAADYVDAPILEIEYDSVDIGSFGDVIPGMTVLVSATTNPRDAKYRGRVDDDLTSSVLPISQNATIINVGDYLIVIADVELTSRVRLGDLASGRFAWTNLPPMISGLPGTLVLYDSDDDDDVLYTSVQEGIATADGAAVDDMTGWAWTISGGGTSSISDATAKHPDFTFEAGFHYLVSVVLTDDNGTSHRQFMHVYAVTRTLTAPVIKPIVTGSIDSDLTNGFSASVTAFGGVSGLVDRSHVAIAKIERWGDNTSAAVLTNLRFTGRIRGESIRTVGSAEAGREAQVGFSVESIASYMSRLSCPNDIVRHQASPATFGEITAPSIYRMLVYYLSTYTTLLSLGSFTAGDGDLLDWLAGGRPVDINGGYVQDVMQNVCERIHAGLNFAPDGSIHIEQLASYKQDRSALVTVMDFTLSDILEYELDRDTSRTTSQVTVFGGSWKTVNNTFVLYTAAAPSIPYSEGEVREITRELLRSDVTTTEAETELKSRAGNEFAYQNSKPLLRLTLRGCWNWLFATGYQRYTATIAANTNSRGIAYTTADKWQLQSVSVNINTDGTDDVTAELVAETEFTDAQSVGNQLPDNVPQTNPIYPVLSDYPAEGDNPLWGLPTDNPTAEELQPIDAYSGYLSYGTMTPGQAAQAGRQQPEPGCFVTQVNMRNSGTTLGDTTVNTDPYLTQVSGFGQISAAGWRQSLNMVSGDNSFAVYGTADGGGVVATYTPATGWTSSFFINSIWGYRGVQIHRVIASSVITRISVTFTITDGTSSTTEPFLAIIDAATVTILKVSFSSPAAGVGSFVWTGNITTTDIGIIVRESINPAPTDGGGSVTITNVTIDGLGTNPFTMTPGAGNVFADAFYFWTEGSEDPAQVFDATAGLLIDGMKPSVLPDYRPDHVYQNIEYIGSGNEIQLNFALSSYDGVDSRLITVKTCENS